MKLADKNKATDGWLISCYPFWKDHKLKTERYGSVAEIEPFMFELVMNAYTHGFYSKHTVRIDVASSILQRIRKLKQGDLE